MGAAFTFIRQAVVRRLLSCLFLGLVVALITDSAEGDPDQPTQAFTNAVLASRSLKWFALAIVVWAVWSFGDTARAAVVSKTSARSTTTAGATPQHWLHPVAVRARLKAQKPAARYLGYAVLLAIAIIGPRLLPSYLQSVAFSAVGIYALLALGLNVVVGYAGLLDLGFIAFFAIGAYVTAYFTKSTEAPTFVFPIPAHAPFQLNGFLILPIAALAAALAGVILGGPTLRLRGDYLAIVTLGFGEIVQKVANNAQNITGGSHGANGLPHLQIAGYDFGTKYLPNYYLVLGIVVLVMVAFSRLEKSRTGRAWAAIREDEVAAAATGVRTLKYKLLAFGIGASTSGFAGVLYASFTNYFDPTDFMYTASILVLTIVIFGGLGNIFGSVIGAAVLQFLAAYLSHSGAVSASDSLIFFGAIVMLMMVFRPQGLIPSRRRAREIKLSEEGVGSADALGSASGPVTGGVSA